ncbi:hypothetical protein AXG93_131s1460 [Marchantia polymorpha subsp. ruderalis]|uniref:U2 snRNP-associated SURP motif-containing protein n=1 Tax=Marchantia polymorpha subsp. ruderalis TaxID=1480154 RepID=A0A176W2K1_MARPO|nr:hypothetical protein AXG93_131s1460 [Marchantia polymorpha subsp. ruderalis]
MRTNAGARLSLDDERGSSTRRKVSLRSCNFWLRPVDAGAIDSRSIGVNCGASMGALRADMSNEKMTSFSVVRKKTPFQKHREEEEAKKKRADEEAARLYEEFVESFKADDTPGGKAFVRGGTINPNERVKPPPPGAQLPDDRGPSTKEMDSTASKKPGSRYVPSFIPPGLAAMVNKEKEPEKRREEDKNKERDRGKSRNIDHFMEELKREQEAREKRSQDREHRRDGRSTRTSGNITVDTIASDNPPTRFDELPEELDANGKLPGSFDDGDPQTTNLYVGNLSPQVDENFLLRTFGRFGPIASVKIMWPRTEEERRRQRNCGFVAFMNRGEAQAAKDEMQGVVVYEYELRIGWGKAVALPAQALPAPPPGQMAVRPKEGATASNVAWSGPGAPPAPTVSGQNAEVVVTPNVPDIQVIPPEDEHLRHVIDTMAMYVLDDGCAFEQAIMERGRGTTLFSFLFDLGSTEHTYYIWRLYSFAQGDTLQRWRTEPFIMITGSGRWIPPALPLQEFSKSPEREKASGTTFAAGRGRRTDQERSLTDSQRDEFEDMLRALTLERSQIREAMGFALDNSEAAGEVVEVLTESLTLKETPIPTKVARLMLVSDVLHNSSAPVKNASAYRTVFESRLPDIMESFNDLYRNITGRITAEALKERVLKVLQVWADWFLFSDAYVNGLRATFLRPGNSGVAPFHTLYGDALAGKENGIPTDGEPGLYVGEGSDTGQDAALAIGEGAAARELANLPFAELERRCRHNGLSTRGGREVMVARLLSLEEAEKQKNHEPEDDSKAGQGYSLHNKGVAVKDGDGMFRMRGEGRWGAGGGWTEVGTGWREISRDERDKIEVGENGDGLREDRRQGLALEITTGLGVQWPRYEEDEDVDSTVRASREGRSGPGSSRTGTLPSTLALPQPELKVFSSKPEKVDPVLPASKWTREDEASDEDEKPDRRGLGLEYSSSGSDDLYGGTPKPDKQDSRVDIIAGAANDTSMDEERRQKLRKLEVSVMEYTESLEERGLKSSEEIERKVSLHRKRLEVDCGLSEGPSLSGRDRNSKGGDLGSERGFLRSSGGFQVHIIVITCTRYQQVLCSCGGCCSSYAH